MKILFCGDVVGRSGRDAVLAHLPTLRQQLDPDFIVVNGENAAGGFGITSEICKQFYAAGVDVITGGNHSWDNREILTHIDGDPRLLRPCKWSMPGTRVAKTPRGWRLSGPAATPTSPTAWR